jgi:uncharacterized protein (TIGR02246 family)
MALAGSAAAPAPGAEPRAEAVVESPGEEGVRSLWSTLDAVWNGRDAARFSDLFTAEGSFQFVDSGLALTGRDAIHRHFAGQFPQLPPELRHLTTVREVALVAPGVRTLDGGVEILRDGGDNAPPAVLKSFAIVAVMLETAEGWRIRLLRAYELPVAVETAAHH